MKVHSHFAMGFPKLVYKRALIIDVGLSFESEVKREILLPAAIDCQTNNWT
ncbi:MAG: hypothetical protein M3352_10285 [Bacteroidota bacterium]|nr:hypothetical protein [Bacteroidota bacterium]